MSIQHQPKRGVTPSKVILFLAASLIVSISTNFVLVSFLQNTQQQSPADKASFPVPKRRPSQERHSRQEIKHKTLSICLLTKDDLEILPEWIAYHYHAVRLRHLVMAVDPSSTEYPTQIVELATSNVLPGLKMSMWQDTDFMPDFFLNGSTGQVPNFIGGGGKNGTFAEWVTKNHVGPVKVRDMHVINNHRYRQTRFVTQCTRYLQRQTPTTDYMSPLDSDEYLVLNPLLNITFDPNKSKQGPWHSMKPGNVMDYLEHARLLNPTLFSTGCLKVPRLLYGFVVDDSVLKLKSKSVFNVSRFETLSWHYHAPWQDERNHLQKVLLDLSMIPSDDIELGSHAEYAFSVHQPSMQMCPPESFESEIVDYNRFPIVGNHYLGSWQRYSRRQDKRRSKRFYSQRANLTAGKENGWLSHWLDAFVESVGLEAAQRFLSNYTNGVSEMQ